MSNTQDNFSGIGAVFKEIAVALTPQEIDEQTRKLARIKNEAELIVAKIKSEIYNSANEYIESRCKS